MSDVGFAGVTGFAYTTTATAVRTMGVAGVGSASAVAQGPSLILNFAGSTTLDPRITFTRASSGTYFDSAGVLQRATYNLLTYSEQFDNAAWGKSNSTVSANAIAAPNGTITGDKLVENTSTAQHFCSQNAVVGANTNITATCYVKFDSSNRTFAMQFTDAPSGGSQYAGVRLLQNGTTVVFDAGFSNRSFSATAVGDGWYRVVLSLTTSAVATITLRLYIVDAAGSSVYTGDGSSGVFLWGAQLEQASTAGPYYATTTAANGAPRLTFNPTTLAPQGLLVEEQRTNLLFPADGITGWAASPPSSVSTTANAGTSPDGTSNATKIATADTSNNGHIWYKTFVGAINTTYVGSCFAKAAEYSRVQISFGNTAFGVTTYGAIFDLSNGTVVTTSGGSTATITSVGNGWYRCTVTGLSDADGGNYVFGATPFPAEINTINAHYTPASTGLGIFMYGAQVEAGAFPTSYIPTVASQATRAADSASMTGTNFSSWYNATEGTLFAESQTVSNPTNNFAVQLSDNSYNNRIVLGQDATNSVAQVIVSGSVTLQPAPAPARSSQSIKQAFGFIVNSAQLAVNGVQATQDSSGAMVSGLTLLSIGSDHSGFNRLNGTIARIAFYPRRLNNAELQGITA